MAAILRRYPALSRALRYTAPLTVPIPLLLTLVAFNMLGFFGVQVRGTHHSYAARVFKYGTIASGLVSMNVDEEAVIQRLRYGHEVVIPPAERPANVVTIQVESLNADVLSATINEEPVMPHLVSRAARAIYYPYMVAQHKAGNSSDAEFSVFNGIEALATFPASQFSRYDYPNAVTSRMTDHSRLAFHGNYGDYFNRFQSLEGMGFDNFYDQGRMGLPDEGWGASDHAVYRFVADQAAGEAGPFYYHIITMTSHGPFDNYANYYHAPLFDAVTTTTERNYLSSMHYVDQSIDTFIDEITAIAPNTWFFIYGDHSVRIEGDGYRSTNRVTIAGEFFEFVPLIVIAPDGRQYREEHQAISSLDLARNILYASGAGGTLYSWGENLLERDGTAELVRPIILNGRAFDRAEVFKTITLRAAP